MGPMLATVLSVYGAAIDGSALAWSIGYNGPVIRGIGNSHGNYVSSWPILHSSPQASKKENDS